MNAGWRWCVGGERGAEVEWCMRSGCALVHTEWRYNCACEVTIEWFM